MQRKASIVAAAARRSKRRLQVQRRRAASCATAGGSRRRRRAEQRCEAPLSACRRSERGCRCLRPLNAAAAASSRQQLRRCAAECFPHHTHRAVPRNKQQRVDEREQQHAQRGRGTRPARLQAQAEHARGPRPGRRKGRCQQAARTRRDKRLLTSMPNRCSCRRLQPGPPRSHRIRQQQR
eukprot:365200-Chlamydomonas_euryale.AAC.12